MRAGRGVIGVRRARATLDEMIGRVLVVDDEPLARERLRTMLRRLAPRLEVIEAGSGTAAVEVLREQAPEAVFLDVELPGCDGLEVVRRVGVEAMPPTVFVTAYDRHALAAFDAAAVDYLLKPYDAERLQRAWKRLLGRGDRRLSGLLDLLARRDDERLIARQGGKTIAVPLEEVRWVESAGNYVVLHAATESYRIRSTLAAVEDRLDPARFVRVHRRFIVDLRAMRELLPWSGGDQLIVLEGGVKLPVSRNFRERLAERLKR